MSKKRVLQNIDQEFVASEQGSELAEAIASARKAREVDVAETKAALAAWSSKAAAVLASEIAILGQLLSENTDRRENGAKAEDAVDAG